MGTWGPGNFDNDAALDWIGDHCDDLSARAEELVAAEDGEGDVDEGGEGELMPIVEVLSVLCEHCGGAPPKADDARRWKQAYLARWDAQIDGLDPDEDYKRERREVIGRTFDRLIEQADAFWKE